MITELIFPEIIPHNHMHQIFWYNFCNMPNYTTSLKTSWLLMWLETTTRLKTQQDIWWCPITWKCKQDNETAHITNHFQQCPCV